MFIGLATSTGVDSDLSGERIYPDTFSINSTSFDVTASYTNGDGAKNVFLYYLDRSTVTGETYTATQSVTVPGAQPSITVTAATHQLANYNIVPQLFVGSGATNWTEITPDSFSISSAGTVTCDFTYNDSTTLPTTAKLILAASPAAQVLTTAFSPGTAQTITIPNVGSPFIFGALYTLSGSNSQLVLPDKQEYNDVTKALTLTYTSASAASGKFCYNYGTIRANELYVSAAGLTPGTDTSPQITLYGLDHATLYGEEKFSERKGWVTHLDSYRSPNTTHMVAGLGGNLFAALTKSESPTTFQSSMPTYYARLQSRLNSPLNIGPAFCDIGDVPARTRGTIAFTSGGTGWGQVSGIEYQASSGWTRYTISTPSLSVTGTPITATPSSLVNASVANSNSLVLIDASLFASSGTILVSGELYTYSGKSSNTLTGISPSITALSGTEVQQPIGDYLTIKNMSHSRHGGTFKIRDYDVLSNPNSITIDVENPSITTSDYDDNGTAGLGGIFTDRFTFSSLNEFIENDTLLSSAWGEDVELIVKSSSGLSSVISNVFDYKELSAGLLIAGLRTSSTLALRNNTNTPAVSNLVIGDTLTCSSLAYPLTITSIDVTSNTITLDQPITWYDDTTNLTTFTVSRRWLPREMPLKDSGDNLINDQIPRYFANNPYINQPFLRSAMVQNNMYLTNGDDEVYKYDGENLYRAGIIPWQPGLFLTAKSGVADGIKLAGISVSAAPDGGTLVVSKADEVQFPVGTVIKYTDSVNTGGIILTVASNVEKSASDHSLTFEEPLAIVSGGTGGIISLVYQARYSFRLNIKDNNGVTVASAVTGANDFVALIAPTATTQYTVYLRLAGFPAWDQYDYRNKNIELKICRTLWTTKALGDIPVFYEVSTKQMPYTGVDGYIDFVDKLGNDTLVTIDAVVSVLSPSTVPAGWDEPARAKYVTSAGNRLVLGNVVDWPTLAISYLTPGVTSYTEYSGQKFLFRKNSEDTSSDTNMVDRVTYELKSTGGVVTSSWSTVAGTSFTFTCIPARSIQAKDWVYLYYGTSTISDLAYSGWWQVSSSTTNSTTTVGTGTTVSTVNVVSTAGFPSSGVVKIGSNTYTYSGTTGASFTGISPLITYTAGQTVTNTTITVPTPLATTAPTTVPYAMFATTALDVPVNIDGDYNMGMYNGDTVSFLTPAIRILRRIGMAINATMRMTNKGLASQSQFIPWLVARSESDTGGQLIVKQPRAEIQIPSVQISGGGTNYKTYINGSQSNGTSVKALVTRYPSRILVSYNNYPEIFDNPWSVDDSLSDSAIDINSSDGQEITGVIPFFGESAFGAALQSGVLVVFKQNSIYLVDLSEKALGKNAVQRIETQGLGCTAPYSIAPTKDGIAFANDSGIYVLRRNQRIEYLGRFMERNWQNKVNKDYLNIVQGHHYSVGRQYKLSVPLLSESLPGYAENSEVYVYNHTNEGTEEPGGWARYTNHPATGWANLYQDAFFANVNGSVMRLRAEDVPEDYRDSGDAIEMTVEGRATDFGNGGIRKIVSHVVVNYRTGGMSDNTYLYTAPDLYQEYDETTPFAVVNIPTDNGFSTVAGQDVTSIRHSLVRRKCIYMTVKISNNGLDEALEIAGMSYVVAGLTSKGITQAATTKAQSGV